MKTFTWHFSGHQLPYGPSGRGEAPPGAHPAPLKGDDGQVRGGPRRRVEGDRMLFF